MTETLKEIIEQVEEQKKDPHFLDQLPTKENPRKDKELSADDPRVINRKLPGKETDYKIRQYYKDVLNKPLVHGPQNKKRAQFIDNFVYGEKPKKPQPAFSQTETFPGLDPKTPVRKPRVVIYDKCMDCLQRVNKDDAVPNMVFIPKPPHLNPITQARWAAVRVRPGDIVCYLFHGSCVRGALAQVKLLGRGIITMENGRPVTAGERYAQERGLRIQNNVFEYLTSECLKPDSDVYYENHSFQ